jgi:hypothetical protein
MIPGVSFANGEQIVFDDYVLPSLEAARYSIATETNDRNGA